MLALCAGSWAAGAGLVEAYVRIRLGGETLYHSNPNITMQLDPASFEGLDPEAVRTAVELAMAEWNSVDHSLINFSLGPDVSNAVVGSPERTIFYDPDGSSGWFGGGASMTVAITPITYSTSDGRIIDIDVIFNGQRWNFATGIQPGAFDIQDVLTHELGHVMGLDHSPVHGSSMWPYVMPQQWLHRSLTQDDQSGAVAVARTGGFAQLRGGLRDHNGDPIQGGAIGAVRALDGRVAGVVLSDQNGSWLMRDVPPGDYYLYCFPLEGTMGRPELTSDGSIQTDFGAAMLGGIWSPQPVTLSAGENLNVGSIWATPDAAVRDNFGHPLILEAGGPPQTFYVVGSGFESGAGTLIEFSPFLSFSDHTGDNSRFAATLTVDPNCPPGSYDVFIALGSGALECIPGAIEVVAPAPELASISATQANVLGGEWIELYGDDFSEDAMVLIGGRLSPDVRFQDATHLRALTPRGNAGAADVVVQHRDGQESRLDDALQFVAIPVYESLFPRAGNIDGGTQLRLVGSGFTSGMTVELGGRTASYRLLSSRVIEITAPAGFALGPVDVRIQSAEGHVDEQADLYTYVSAPDPDIESFTPRTGKRSGGTEVNLLGDHLADGVQVRFGVDPISVQGGRYAGGVERVSAAELRSRTPGGSAGEFAVVVELPNGQGAISDTLFSYQPESGGGGCGGVASGGKPGEPVDWLPIVGVVVFWWSASRRRAKPETAAARAR